MRNSLQYGSRGRAYEFACLIMDADDAKDISLHSKCIPSVGTIPLPHPLNQPSVKQIISANVLIHVRNALGDLLQTKKESIAEAASHLSIMKHQLEDMART